MCVGMCANSGVERDGDGVLAEEMKVRLWLPETDSDPPCRPSSHSNRLIWQHLQRRLSDTFPSCFFLSLLRTMPYVQSPRDNRIAPSCAAALYQNLHRLSLADQRYSALLIRPVCSSSVLPRSGETARLASVAIRKVLSSSPSPSSVSHEHCPSGSPSVRFLGSSRKEGVKETTAAVFCLRVTSYKSKPLFRCVRVCKFSFMLLQRRCNEAKKNAVSRVQANVVSECVRDHGR